MAKGGGGKLGIDTLLAITIGAFTLIMKWWPVSIGSSSGPSSVVVAIAQAIANAEGFGQPGAIPTVRNNPGDIENLSGVVKTYDTVQDGWNALYDYIQRMIDGTWIYNTGQTWAQIGGIYSGTPGGPWATNVASFLGVDVNSTLGDYVNGGVNA